jgi:hypothetical protein
MKKTIYLIIGVLGIVSCKKEVIPDEPPYIVQWWDKFYGTYVVFDTLNDVTYQMEINQIERYFDGKSFEDSIEVKNAANMFDLKIKQTSINATHLKFGNHFGIVDREGQRWSFFGTSYWGDSGDTLKVYLELSNIAFYLEDGVPYYESVWTDLAIKQ